MPSSQFSRGTETTQVTIRESQAAAQDELSRGRAAARAAGGNRSIGGNTATHTRVGSLQSRATGRN
jgi:hypothetical protein